MCCQSQQPGYKICNPCVRQGIMNDLSKAVFTGKDQPEQHIYCPFCNARNFEVLRHGGQQCTADKIVNMQDAIQCSKTIKHRMDQHILRMKEHYMLRDRKLVLKVLIPLVRVIALYPRGSTNV